MSVFSAYTCVPISFQPVEELVSSSYSEADFPVCHYPCTFILHFIWPFYCSTSMDIEKGGVCDRVWLLKKKVLKLGNHEKPNIYTP